MDVSQRVESLIFAAADPAVAQGAYCGPTGFAGLAGPMKRVRLPRSARRDAVLLASLWTVAEQLTDAKLALSNAALAPRSRRGLSVKTTY